MKKCFKLLLISLLLLLAIAIIPGCAAGDEGEGMPPELLAVVDKVVTFVEKYARQLDGEWGDMHAMLVGSGEGEDFPNYFEMQAVLQGFVGESNVVRVYAMYPPGSKYITPYAVTVDGSLYARGYGTLCEWEEAFTAAWEGETKSSGRASFDARGNLFISAYAPVYDRAGNVTAILGVDYPAPEAADFQDWIDNGE
jgi:hypothetical protein